MAASAYYTQVQNMYVAYFGRPADKGGLDYYADLLNKNGGNDKAMLHDFANSTESKALYNQASLSAKIAAIYQTLFNKADDFDGVAYWANEVRTGKVILSEAAAAIAFNAQPAEKAIYAAKLEAAAKFTAEINSVNELIAYETDPSAGRTWLAAVKDTATATAALQTIDATLAAVVAGVDTNAGKTFTLTTGVDQGEAFTGAAGNDTFVATINTAATTTWTGLDVINGGAGTDTMTINAITDVAVPGGATVSNIEKVQINAVAKVGTFTADGKGNLDVSTVFAGVSDLTITSATDVDLLAGEHTAVTLNGATGNVEIVGGYAQTVSLAAQGGDVALSGSTGAISVTSSKHGAKNIDIDGGSTVTVKTTSTVDNGAIEIGTTKQATGAVTVTSNLNGDGTATLDQGDITITGGSSVTVNSTLTINAKNETADDAHTFGNVVVNSDGKTASVTINQNYVETEFTKAAVATTKELHTVTFKALAANQSTTVDGLTFTASKALTAAEVAQAFSNLTASDTQTSGGKVANGVFTGALSANFTSGAASGAVVVFTAVDEAETLDLSAGDVDPTETVAAGKAGSLVATSNNTVTYGTVRVDDAATASITTLTVNGYASADLGNTGNDLNALTTLSLANSGGAATVDTTAATLGLTVNKVNHDVDLSGAAALKTLNVTATGANSTFGLIAGSVEALTVAGDKVLDIDTGSTLTNLKTVTVSGSAGLSIDASGAAVTSVNTSATTGAVTATINATKATYTGGAGVDTVTLATGTALTKAVDLGDGDDTLIFDAAVTGSTAKLSGGNGTDTVSMTVAHADALDVTTQTFYTNFERLTLNNAAGTNDGNVDAIAVNLENLGFTNYVTTSGTVYGTGANAGKNDTLTLNNLANNGTVALTAMGLVTAVVKDAAEAANTSDVVNVIANVADTPIDFGTFTVANVETVNVSANDKLVDDDGDGDIPAAEAVAEKATLVLTAADAKTVNITGDAKVDLVLTGSTKVTLVDGSAMTEALNVTSVNATSAVTIKGGAGNDVLVSAASSTQADELHGGAGNDSLTANKGLAKLYGGAGTDTFNVVVASTNVNSAATIMDLGSGDIIKFAGADAFKSAAISLDTTAIFQDYANAAIASITSQNDLAWFQFGGNTYIVQEKDEDAVTGGYQDTNADVFVNNVDFIVKIAGLVDLSTASFNATNGTLEIA